MVVGAFYFAGEELSWGQHVFGWATPDEWARLNSQSETNLHNLELLDDGNLHELFNKWPRAALSLLVAIGLAGAAFRYIATRLGEDRLRDFFSQPVWPSMSFIPVAVAVLAFRPVASLVESFSWMTAGEVAAGEVKECLLALAIMLYVTALRRSLLFEAHCDDGRGC